MSETPLQAPGIKVQYATQVAADLKHNTEEQERIAVEAAALQTQLLALRHDHELLVSVQRALGDEGAAVPAPAPAATATDDTAQVPKPRSAAARPATPARKKAVAAKADKPGRTEKPGKAEKPAKADNKTADNKSKASGARTEAPRKATQPTLVTLVREHLAQDTKPQSAAEIAAALGESHPDRGVKTTVVRNTLEGLVARGESLRTRQGSSVFYTAPGTEPAVAAEKAEPATA